MKKIMIALLIVASIFVLASCAPALVTQTLTLKSVDGQVASGSVSVTKDDNAKAYYLSNGSYLALPASEKGDYGTLTYAKTQLDGSSQDTYAFAYKGDVGATGSENQGKVYIGVLNSDAKSFKTKYAEVTINASAEWNGSTPVAIALSNETGKDTVSKVLAAAGEKIYVDGKEYSAAVEVKSTADTKIGTLAAELTVEKTAIKFTFTDTLDKYDDSVSGKAIKVEVKNGTTVVATYSVTCSHVGTPVPKDEIILETDAQAVKAVTKTSELAYSGTSLAVYTVSSNDREVAAGVVSRKLAEDTFVPLKINDALIKVETPVALLDITAEGSKTDITGLKFSLETAGQAVGSATEEIKLVFRTNDKDKALVAKYTVKVDVAYKEVSVNSVVGKVIVPMAKNSDDTYWLLNSDKGIWTQISSDNSAYVLNDAGDYCGVLNATTEVVSEVTVPVIKFSTPDMQFGTSSIKVPAECGKGSAVIGINYDATAGCDGTFILNYENVEVKNQIDVVDSKTEDGMFEIDGGRKCSLYVRMVKSDSTALTGIVWDEWTDDLTNACFYNVSVTADRFEVGKFSYMAKTSVYQCWFDGSTTTEGYGKEGYIQLAVVDATTGDVLSTYEVNGYNGWTLSNN